MGTTVKIRKKVSAIDKARTAMAIDCEGTIALYLKVSPKEYPEVSVRVSVANTWIPLLEELAKTWRIGHIYGNSTSSYVSRKDEFAWQVGNREDVEWLLKSVHKYLLVKRPQAALLLRAISYLNECRPRKHGGKNSKYSVEDKKKISEFVMVSRFLNGRREQDGRR